MMDKRSRDQIEQTTSEHHPNDTPETREDGSTEGFESNTIDDAGIEDVDGRYDESDG